MKYNLTYLDNYYLYQTSPQTSKKVILNNDRFVINKKQLRIMIIGDSYIEGIGIKEPLRFKNQLEEIFKTNNTLNKDPIILNLSHPGDIAIDKYFAFLSSYNKFQPHYVLWFHTINDLSFLDPRKVSNLKKELVTLEKHNKKPLTNNNLYSISKEVQIKKKKSDDNFLKSLDNFKNQSHLLSYLASNLFNEFLLRGFLVPFGEFYKITQRLYKTNSNEWKLFEDIFEDIFYQIDKKNTKLVIYSMPEYNLTNQPQLFKNVDYSLYNFFNDKNVIYIDGKDDLIDYNFNQVSSTRSDGHPNEIAHKIISETIAKLIFDNLNI